MHLLDLPEELLCDVARHLDAKSALQYSYSCKHLQHVTSADSFWRDLLLACGFGKAWYTNSTCKQHLTLLLNHCKYCALCSVQWDQSVSRNVNDPQSEDNSINLPLSRLVAMPPAKISPFNANIFLPALHPRLKAAFPNSTLRDTHHPERPDWLHEHPVYESLLVTAKPVKDVEWAIKRHYIVQEDRYPREDERSRPEDLQSRIWPCGRLSSSIGVTLCDIMLALIRKLHVGPLSRGPGRLQYCEWAEPGVLLLVLGDHVCINEDAAVEA